MRIIETSIPDIHSNNIDASKINLAEKIIGNVYPLFDEIQSEKIASISSSRRELETKKKTVQQSKIDIEKFVNEFKRRKKVKVLLEKISKLVSLGLASDGTARNELIVLLKIIDKLPDDKLDSQINKTTRIIAKRFGS